MFAFQSPSRGGHLRGPFKTIIIVVLVVGFSPLHEGDTSVAVLNVVILYQPFTRFSPLHEGDTSVAPLPGRPQRGRPGFSPLHEGDTSVASVACCSAMSCNSSFSPLHEGDTSVALQLLPLAR